MRAPKRGSAANARRQLVVPSSVRREIRGRGFGIARPRQIGDDARWQCGLKHGLRHPQLMGADRRQPVFGRARSANSANCVRRQTRRQANGCRRSTALAARCGDASPDGYRRAAARRSLRPSSRADPAPAAGCARGSMSSYVRTPSKTGWVLIFQWMSKTWHTPNASIFCISNCENTSSQYTVAEYPSDDNTRRAISTSADAMSRSVSSRGRNAGASYTVYARGVPLMRIGLTPARVSASSTAWVSTPRSSSSPASVRAASERHSSNRGGQPAFAGNWEKR